MAKAKGRLYLCVYAWIALIIAYGYGLATAHYHLFPYCLIKRVGNNKENSAYYTRRQDFFELCGERADVVMIGDSLTDGAEWRELFPQISIVNRGIIGDTTKGLAGRLESIYSTNANKAFLMIGVNDFLRGADVDGVFQTYKRIIHGLQTHNIKLHIQSTLIGRKDNKELCRKVTELNQRLLELSRKEDTVFIDLNAILAPDGELSSDFSDDGVHLNGAGYLLWKDVIEEYLKE